MIFNLRDYKQGRYAMRCPDHEKARIFLRYLHDNGRTWTQGVSYLKQDNYDVYRENTCYSFNDGTFADTNYFVTHEWEILSFDDFEWDDFCDLEVTEKDNQEFNQFISQFSQQGASVNYGV